MISRTIASVALSTAIFCASALADDAAPNWTSKNAPPPAAGNQDQAIIHFASRGGIFNWEVKDENSIYVQDRTRQWYRGDLMAPCIGLTFDLRVGFTFEPNGDFDKFSSIRHGHQTCNLKSLVKVDAVPGHKPKNAKASGTSAPVDTTQPQTAAEK